MRAEGNCSPPFDFARFDYAHRRQGRQGKQGKRVGGGCGWGKW